MHDTARDLGQLFFDSYCAKDGLTVLELGSLNVNGSLRDQARPGWDYIGVDAVAGPGVDRLVAPGSAWPVDNESVDVVVSSSVFEHDRFFWRTFLEMARVLRRSGLVYLNVPSNGGVHRFPQDCWRFYPDAGHALSAWSGDNGVEMVLLESFVADRKDDVWNDVVCVFLKSGVAPATLSEISMASMVRSRNAYHHARGLAPTHWETQDMELLRLAGAKE